LSPRHTSPLTLSSSVFASLLSCVELKAFLSHYRPSPPLSSRRRRKSEAAFSFPLFDVETRVARCKQHFKSDIIESVKILVNYRSLSFVTQPSHPSTHHSCLKTTSGNPVSSRTQYFYSTWCAGLVYNFCCQENFLIELHYNICETFTLNA
jgi:hypothetical protein